MTTPRSRASASTPPPDPELYGAWAATVAERYKGGLVSAYEIWNEPNYTAYWTAGPDPEHYTEILRLHTTPSTRSTRTRWSSPESLAPFRIPA